jgi:hypothetical protein
LRNCIEKESIPLKEKNNAVLDMTDLYKEYQKKQLSPSLPGSSSILKGYTNNPIRIKAEKKEKAILTLLIYYRKWRRKSRQSPDPFINCSQDLQFAGKCN